MSIHDSHDIFYLVWSGHDKVPLRTKDVICVIHQIVVKNYAEICWITLENASTCNNVNQLFLYSYPKSYFRLFVFMGSAGLIKYGHNF